MGAKELQGQGRMLSLMVEETPDVLYWSRSGQVDQRGTNSLANVCQPVAPPDFGLENWSERTVPRRCAGPRARLGAKWTLCRSEGWVKGAVRGASSAPAVRPRAGAAPFAAQVGTSVRTLPPGTANAAAAFALQNKWAAHCGRGGPRTLPGETGTRSLV